MCGIECLPNVNFVIYMFNKEYSSVSKFANINILVKMADFWFGVKQ